MFFLDFRKGPLSFSFYKSMAEEVIIKKCNEFFLQLPAWTTVEVQYPVNGNFLLQKRNITRFYLYVNGAYFWCVVFLCFTRNTL